HYVDEGPADGELVLCWHGQPVWSYSFRKMIPPLTAAGYRVIVPDLVGFGRSDKPLRRSDYTFANHVSWMNSFVRELRLADITLVCQDWGGIIGLRVVTDNMDRFARVVATNTGLPDARGVADEMVSKLREMLAATPVLPPLAMTEKLRPKPDAQHAGWQAQAGAAKGADGAEDAPGFMYWIKFADGYPDFDPGQIMSMWLNECSAEERRAYAAPFPNEEYMQGAREFPSLVPLLPDNPGVAGNRKAWEILRSFDRPFLTAYSEEDAGVSDTLFQQEVPGAIGQNHVVIKGAGHYSQDDAGEELARIVIDFMRTS
ncbi:MAG: haloalkane dehalogenase, partial [Pseudomonadales bacterium]